MNEEGNAHSLHEQTCQRCGALPPEGEGPRILWINAFGIDELSLPLRYRDCWPTWDPEHYEAWEQARAESGCRSCLEAYGLLLCDACLEEFYEALGGWWIRTPGHVLDERLAAWDQAAERRRGPGAPA